MTSVSLWVVAALLVQGGIALVLLWVLGTIRIPLVQAGKIRIPDIALSREPWPLAEKQVSNAFDNQFQLPVLFYVASGLALYFGATVFEAILVWLFVLTRIVHAVIFATRNRVVPRFFVYTTGYLILSVLWLDLAVRLIIIAMGSR